MIEYAQLLTALAVFGYASWTDIESRRVDNRVWVVGSIIGIILIALEVLVNYGNMFYLREFAVTTAASILILSAMGISFYYLGFFGGADGKALITLGILLPTYPSISLLGNTFPLYNSEITIFSLAVLMNGLILTLFYPIILGISNGAEFFSKFPYSFVYKRISFREIGTAHGKLITESDGSISLDGMDLDALRMYFEWRDISLEDLRENPRYYRLVPPEKVNDVGDGRVTDVLSPMPDDPWSAEKFCEGHYTYGTTPEQLRKGLLEVSTNDELMVMPGIPLIVSFFVGILSALIVGDIITAVLLFIV